MGKTTPPRWSHALVSNDQAAPSIVVGPPGGKTPVRCTSAPNIAPSLLSVEQPPSSTGASIAQKKKTALVTGASVVSELDALETNRSESSMGSGAIGGNRVACLAYLCRLIGPNRHGVGYRFGILGIGLGIGAGGGGITPVFENGP